MTRLPNMMCVAVCLAVVLMNPAQAEPLADRVADRVLYRKPLEEGREIVVTRQQLTKQQRLSPLVDETKAQGIYSILVELHSKAEPVVLASRIQWETEWLDTGFTVLDVIVAPGELIFAVGVGAELALWNIRFGTVSTDSWTILRGWSFIALARPITPETQNLEFVRQAEGHWLVKVTELRDGKPVTSPTEYQQDATGWRLTKRGDLLGQ
jgi:hypothetical protein